MTHSRVMQSLLKIVVLTSLAGTLSAQQSAPARGARGAGGRGGGGAAQGARGAAAGARGGAAQARVPLFFKEEWKNDTGEYEPKVGPNFVASSDLEVKVYGPSGQEILIAGAANNETNPVHPWTGMCTSPCGLTLRDKTRMVDLTGLARIKWVTKMSGFHQVRPLVKLADGTMLVGDFADGSTADWQEREFTLSTVKWIRIDPERAVTTGSIVANPDLSKVDEVGFVDLMPGSGHGQGGWADVAKIEVYGKPVPR